MSGEISFEEWMGSNPEIPTHSGDEANWASWKCGGGPHQPTANPIRRNHPEYLDVDGIFEQDGILRDTGTTDAEHRARLSEFEQWPGMAARFVIQGTMGKYIAVDHSQVT